jgi:hypothetical protein
VILRGLSATPVSLSEASDLSESELTAALEEGTQPINELDDRSTVSASETAPDANTQVNTSTVEDEEMIDAFDDSFEEMSGAEDYKPTEDQKLTHSSHVRGSNQHGQKTDKKSTTPTSEQAELDPTLYGLRRSSRVRSTPQQYNEVR